MDNLEEAAQRAADRWRDRESAKEDLRILIQLLSAKHSMTEISHIVGIQRTTLYYFLYGRDGKTNSAIRQNDNRLQLHESNGYYRKSA